MYWDSFRFVARDLRVRYMLAPSRSRQKKIARRERVVAKFLVRPNPWKTFKTGTFACTLSRLVQSKLFIIMSIQQYAADSKSAGHRPLGFDHSS